MPVVRWEITEPKVMGGRNSVFFRVNTNYIEVFEMSIKRK